MHSFPAFAGQVQIAHWSGLADDFHDLVKVAGKELVILNIVNHTTCQQQDQEK